MIIIGLGNWYRQDDAVGLVVARRLCALAPELPVVEHDAGPLELLSLWSGHDLAILIDALNAPLEPGKVRRFDLREDVVPGRDLVVSSHGHSLWDAFQLACSLEQQPERTLVYTISGARFGHGEGLSPEVERAIDDVLDSVLAAVSQHKSPGFQLGR